MGFTFAERCFAVNSHPVRYTGSFTDGFPSFGIVFAYRILSNIDKPLTVHGHAVALWRVKGTDDVAVFVDLNHRRR
jgi:hypothetical protein